MVLTGVDADRIGASLQVALYPIVVISFVHQSETIESL